MSNLVLLPATKKQWIKKANEAFQANEYDAATTHYQALVSHDVHSYEIHVNLLISLIKLRQLNEAEYYGELFMEYHQADHYFEFVELFMMILYEGQQFSRVMKLIQEATTKKNVPIELNEKFREMYSICDELNKPIEQALRVKLEEAIQAEQHQQQWRILHEWIQLGMQAEASLANYLQDPLIHPMIKTKILEILQAQQYTKPVKIEKFGSYKTVQTNQLLPIKQEMNYNQMLYHLQIIEQENPTLYSLVQDLMDQYCYVMFPFQMNEAELPRLTEAFIQVGQQHFSFGEAEHIEDVKLELYIQNIALCSQLYANITVF